MKIEDELKESVISGLCMHKILGKHTGNYLTKNCRECEGYSALLEGDEVVFCKRYRRITRLSFHNDADTHEKKTV